MDNIFKKAIFISLLGHMTIFSIFGFTFGTRINMANYKGISFLGSILRNWDLNNRIYVWRSPSRASISSARGADTSILDKANEGYVVLPQAYFKPYASLFSSTEKAIFKPIKQPLSFIEKKKEPAVYLYPPLPYHFLLYFKDRQMAHIELAFNITSEDQTSNILIKRKISSGNLEADLLSMRYISHYLFIQQARFIPNTWQTVKIDLSARDGR